MAKTSHLAYKSDAMKVLQNLPNYDIFSKASNFDSLKQADVDVSIITKMNSCYYPAHEFIKR